MQILAMESRVSRAVRDDDSRLAGATAAQVRTAMEPHLTAWREIDSLRKILVEQEGFPEEDSSCLVHNEPIFGESNPPDPAEYLYHYTRIATLPRISGSHSLRLRPLSDMNDPQEALDSRAFQTGLIGPAGSDLRITAEEDVVFKATDWTAEINSARRRVKVASFSRDALPDLSDVDPEHAGHIVPRRLAAHRGFAHPRMWAQYADGGSGACLILSNVHLKAAIEKAAGNEFSWGFGEVSYDAADHEQSLGFFDARSLLRQGAAGALLENFQESLLTKHADWAHEAEFRFFVMDGSPDPLLIPISSEVVAGLILGPTFDPSSQLRAVRAFAYAFDIPGRVRLLHWTHGRAELLRVCLPPYVTRRRTRRGSRKVS